MLINSTTLTLKYSSDIPHAETAYYKCTFEFSGLTFFVLISGSVRTTRLHHSILLFCTEKNHTFRKLMNIHEEIDGKCSLGNTYLNALVFVQTGSCTFSTKRTTLFLSSMTQLLSSTLISPKVSPSMTGVRPLIPTFNRFLSITTVMSLPLSGNVTSNGM